VIGTGTAYSANGGIFRLGRSNSATVTTTLTNTRGTALQLNSKAGQPSLRVNRSTKVLSLNADLLDGADSGSFAPPAARWSAVVAATSPTYARCWNPRADVGSTLRTTQAQALQTVSPAGRRAIERAAAKN
jgi:hypothetical protein